MAEESLIEKALEAILPKPKKRTARKPTHSAQLAAVQKKLTQLSRDVEKLARMVGKGGGGAAKKTTARTAKPARATTKKTAARTKVRVKKPLKKS
jgi:hypothetical protein